MGSLWLLSGLCAFVMALGVVEYALHRRNLAKVPLRIHVNGTRGKSSVTRLIAAGLRAGGRTVCAKTTGTLARMILPDGREYPVFRPAGANVIEQTRIVAAAEAYGADAVVIECMALQPALQWLSEARLVHATHAVITNTRPDHLEVMGPDEDGVAWALAGMIPKGQKLYTAERRRLHILQAAAADRQAQVIDVTPEEVAAITPEALGGFSYLEHADNLALALRVCADLGVDRDTALKGMWAAPPDPGVLREYCLQWFGRTVWFVNGFAANDPESTERIWQAAVDRRGDVGARVAVFNCRTDRPDRSMVLGQACVRWAEADHYVLVGTGTYLFARAFGRAGGPTSRLVFADDQPVQDVFETIVGLVGKRSLVMGMGNIGGIGLEMTALFRNRAALPEEDPA